MFVSLQRYNNKIFTVECVKNKSGCIINHNTMWCVSHFLFSECVKYNMLFITAYIDLKFMSCCT